MRIFIFILLLFSNIFCRSQILQPNVFAAASSIVPEDTTDHFYFNLNTNHFAIYMGFDSGNGKFVILVNPGDGTGVTRDTLTLDNGFTFNYNYSGYGAYTVHVDSIKIIDKEGESLIPYLGLSSEIETSIIVMHLPSFQEFGFNDNQITSLDISQSKTIWYMAVYNTNMTEQALTSLINQLPQCPQFGICGIQLWPQNGGYPQTPTPTQCAILIGKGYNCADCSQ